MLFFQSLCKCPCCCQVVFVRPSLVDSPEELQGAYRIPSPAAEFIHNCESLVDQLFLQGSMMYLPVATGREYKCPFSCHCRQRLHKLKERLVVFTEIDPGPEPDQVIRRGAGGLPL